jgi:hypothetical protein
LLSRLRLQLSRTEAAEVQEFLDAGEFGLALETLSAILVEEHKLVERVVLDEVSVIAVSMGLQDDLFMYDLTNYFNKQ